MLRPEYFISIHAPAKGATATGSPCLQVMTFQSTLPRRERPSACVRSYTHSINFNPRSREGSDRCAHVRCRACKLFQSTLPRRERLDGSGNKITDAEFQSTLPRRERRQRPGDTDILLGISIHAPAKGATKQRAMERGIRKTFQSTLPRRERPPLQHTALQEGYFNPRSREGSDSIY